MEMTTMTPDDVKALTAPFEASEHEFLRGMTYLTESAITRRLDEVDPAWSFRISLVEHRADKVVVYAAMTVCGVTRESNGMEASAYKQGVDRVPENEANYPEKAAVTDALKRCARLFGIGRYILDLPENVKDMRALSAWLNSRSGSTPSSVSKTPPPPSTPSADGTGFTPDTAREFVAHWFKKEMLSTESILKALGIKAFGEWKQTVADAHGRVALMVDALKEQTA
jgi:hypothetical protein